MPDNKQAQLIHLIENWVQCLRGIFNAFDVKGHIDIHIFPKDFSPPVNKEEYDFANKTALINSFRQTPEFDEALRKKKK